MQSLFLTLPTPAENLALDEALLDWAEATDPRAEYLRVWESPTPLVVVGRSSRLHLEVNQQACAAQAIPVLRRSSGGAAIVAGPGCLMYAVVLSYELHPELHDIRMAHKFVLGRLAESLRPLVPTIRLEGTSDLVMGDKGQPARKFSGNSLRAKRSHLLYHGTLLCGFDLSLVSAYLLMPPKQPEYRKARSHAAFVTNLPLSRSTLEQAINSTWPTTAELSNWPRESVAQLVEERFGRDEWNYVFGRDANAS